MKWFVRAGCSAVACLLSLYGCRTAEDPTHGAAGARDTSGGAGGHEGGGEAGQGHGGAAGAPESAGQGEPGGEGGHAGRTGAPTGGAAGRSGHGGKGGSTGAGGSPAVSGGAAGDDASAAGGEAGSGGPGAGIGGCIEALFGRYLLRTDGVLLFESESGAGQPPILDAATALPLTHIASVMDGVYHGCAVLTDGSVDCWRIDASGNGAGQLGDGTKDGGPLYRATPVLVAADEPLEHVVALAEGSSRTWGTNSCAIDNDGGVSCWGDVTWLTNGGASLGSPYALKVTSDGVTPFTGVVQMSTGGDGSYCALTGGSSKSVYCWGPNSNGELGTGDTSGKPYPTKVLGLGSPTKVITFGWGVSTCVIDAGKVRCWGANGAGIAGPSATSGTVLTPTLVTLMGGTTPLADIVDIRGGSADVIQGIGNNTVCALASDKTLKCWGSGFQGYPTTYGLTDIVAAGDLSYGSPRVLTRDGVYHVGMTAVEPNCSAL